MPYPKDLRATSALHPIAAKTFQIIHPFHPLFDRHFELVSTRWNWQQEWVYLHDDAGRLASVPTDWTSLSAPDPFLVLSNGRAQFRPDDLVRLADLIEGLWQVQAIGYRM